MDREFQMLSQKTLGNWTFTKHILKTIGALSLTGRGLKYVQLCYNYKIQELK
jgi:hypothetical protein